MKWSLSMLKRVPLNVFSVYFLFFSPAFFPLKFIYLETSMEHRSRTDARTSICLHILRCTRHDVYNGVHQRIRKEEGQKKSLTKRWWNSPPFPPLSLSLWWISRRCIREVESHVCKWLPSRALIRSASKLNWKVKKIVKSSSKVIRFMNCV